MKPIRVHYENLAKHGITPEEVRECFREGILRYFKKERRGVYQIIAQTLALEIVYEDRSYEYFVFYAMDARAHHIKLLKRRGKRR